MFCAALGCVGDINPPQLKKSFWKSGTFCFSQVPNVFTLLSSCSPSPSNPQGRWRTNVLRHFRREAASAVGKFGHGDEARWVTVCTQWREKLIRRSWCSVWHQELLFSLLSAVCSSALAWFLLLHCWRWMFQQDNVPWTTSRGRELQERTRLNDCLCVSAAAKPFQIQM